MSDTVTMRKTQSSQLSDTIACLHSYSSHEDAFSRMCSSLLETVSTHKVIQDRYLLDFSKFAVQIISNAIEELPESFNMLVKTFLDYLHYSVRSDPDPDRVLSYIRAYQITSLLDVYRMEQKHEELLRKELKVNRQNENLLFYIFQSPGITSSELQTKLGYSISELNKRTCQLEEKKLLSKHQTEYEDEPYFMLSSLGRDLCQDLFATRIHRVMPNRWSYERVCIFYILLKAQPVSSDGEIPIMTWIRKVSEMREDDVQYFALKMKKHVKKHDFEKTSDKEILINGEDIDALPKVRSTAQSIPISQLGFQSDDYDTVNRGGYYGEYYIGSKES